MIAMRMDTKYIIHVYYNTLFYNIKAIKFSNKCQRLR